MRPITVDEVVAAATAATGGLTDQGGDDHLPGLEVLLRSAASSPHAGDVLRARVLASATNALAARLASQAGWTARPDCLADDVAPVLAVMGLPRTGTTAMHQLLAGDPGYQWIPAWMAGRPRPRPLRKAWEDDPQHQAYVAGYRHNPLHEVGPDDPEECLQVMQQSFVSMTWVSSLPLPEYHEWFVEQDERASYRRYADNLRLIGADAGDQPWLLKNPSHTFGLAAMLDVFPTARFVHTYRDPVESIVSGCSLISRMGTGEGGFTPEELGAHRLETWARAAERMAAARDAHPEVPVVDVAFRQLGADPIGTAEGIYDALGLSLSEEAADGMRRWQAERPKDKHGRHEYSPEQFGLSAGRIRERMADYVERYGV